MSLNDETIDPRDCTYRLLASSKLRKQIERILRSKRIELGLIEPKTDPADFYSQFSSSDNYSKLVNRGKNQKNIKENDIENIKDKLKQFDDEIKLWKNKIELVEEILNRSDEDQKQTFTFDDIFKLHQLLQHLDQENLTGAQSFFCLFQEANFRLMQIPEKRQNQSLDERLRKLKYKAAGDEYDSMVANVAHYIIRGNNKNKTNNRFGGSGFGEEFRNLRSTIMATINALMVIGATFLFFYVLLGYLRPDFELAKIVLYSFVASMIVAVAEIYFLIRII